jgi:hypothetical protein
MEGFAWFNSRCWCFGKQTYKGFGSMSYMHARFRGYLPLNVNLLMRINSTNIQDEGLRIGGRATTRDSGIEIGTRRTQIHVPAVEDRYILLAI